MCNIWTLFVCAGYTCAHNVISYLPVIVLPGRRRKQGLLRGINEFPSEGCEGAIGFAWHATDWLTDMSCAYFSAPFRMSRGRVHLLALLVFLDCPFERYRNIQRWQKRNVNFVKQQLPAVVKQQQEEISRSHVPSLFTISVQGNKIR